MEFTFKRTTQIIAALLFAAAVTQVVYTALYVAKADVPRQLLWGAEGLIFTLLAAIAGSALVAAKSYTLGFSAIAMSAVLNVVQVGVGLTMFGPFRVAADQIEALAPVAGAVVALSFMIYNAAKILLGLAALVFGMARMNAGSKALGGLTAVVGVIAMGANAGSMGMGRDFLGEFPLAGGSGVLATVLLAICLLGTAKES